MAANPLRSASVINPGFPGGTKLQILLLLRRSPRTVQELAAALHLTDNAVRSHVVALERDQLIATDGRRPGLRKPATLYTLTDAADRMFGKPYPEVLGALIGEVRARHGIDETTAVMRDIGARLAREQFRPLTGRHGKEAIDAIVQAIDVLGGLAEVEERDGRLIVQGYDCPLVAVASSCPEVCQLTGALLEGLIGSGTVQESCQRGKEVSCRFEVSLPAIADAPAGER
jgi:predicted ArsR family transcriptional regulator